MRMIYGTGNRAKLKWMRKVLSPLRIELIGLDEVAGELPLIEETGSDPLENATIKARAYFAALGEGVFSCDSGLYIEGLEGARQPGVHVRTVMGRALTDDEMIDYYAGIARSLGGRCRARYQNGICLIAQGGQEYREMSDALSTEWFYLAGEPHPRRNAGFPLDSLSVDIASGKYYYDITTPFARNCDEGYRAFFARALGLMEGLIDE